MRVLCTFWLVRQTLGSMPGVLAAILMGYDCSFRAGPAEGFPPTSQIAAFAACFKLTAFHTSVLMNYIYNLADGFPGLHPEASQKNSIFWQYTD